MNLGQYILRRADRDVARRWGGTVRHGHSGDYVKSLQTALTRIGCYSGRLDGDFGVATEFALRLFQWNAGNIPFRIVRRSVFVLSRHFVGPISGVLDGTTRTELSLWDQQGFLATGDLVRVNAGGFANVSLAPTFRTVSPGVGQHEFVVSKDFADDFVVMNSEASKLGITVQVNQTFRSESVPVSGAVVRPASRSQHKIGHAVDVNLLDPPSRNGAADFRAGSETAAARAFVAAMKANGLRWGGDWSRSDPIHYDRMVTSSSFNYDAKFFFNQLTVRDTHPIKVWVLARAR